MWRDSIRDWKYLRPVTVRARYESTYFESSFYRAALLGTGNSTATVTMRCKGRPSLEVSGDHGRLLTVSTARSLSESSGSNQFYAVSVAFRATRNLNVGASTCSARYKKAWRRAAEYLK